MPMWATDAGELPPPHPPSNRKAATTSAVPTMRRCTGRDRVPPSVAPTSVVPVRPPVGPDGQSWGRRRSRPISTWYIPCGNTGATGAVLPRGLERADALEFDAFVSQRVVEILAERRASRVTFIAKSRGTLFLSAMGEMPLPADVDAIWVTSLLGFDYVRDGVVDKRWPSLLVAGSADRYHDPDAHAKVRETIGAESLIIDGADHGLVVGGSVRATVEGFRALAEASLAFAARDV